ncbi:MAG: ion transporter [Candidatus Krumholzibacteriota bacterium]|nr:ion transporter [Candidatus Krumholzibacteriota bacterium]
MDLHARGFQRRVHEILEMARPGDRASRFFDIFILTLIGLNILALMLETVGSLYWRHYHAFQYFEAGSVIIFTAEYLLRLWSCTSDPSYRHPVTGRLRYSLRFLLLVDLLAIAPFYIPLLFGGLDLRFVRAFRLMRIFRLVKVGRYSRSLQTLGRVLHSKREELILVLFVLLLLLVISSSLLYEIEHHHQPEAFSSIPATMWWAVTTLTTVGYGDMCPVTPLGRLFASAIAILGIGLFAIPAGILSAGFSEEMGRLRGHAAARGEGAGNASDA